jgi:hypothetical protein
MAGSMADARSSLNGDVDNGTHSALTMQARVRQLRISKQKQV